MYTNFYFNNNKLFFKYFKEILTAYIKRSCEKRFKFYIIYWFRIFGHSAFIYTASEAYI